MRIHSLQRRVKTCVPVYLVILWLALGSFAPLWADNGTAIPAPTKVPGSIVIDGTINSTSTESVWAPSLPVGKIPNDCDQFNMMSTAPDVTLFALNDGTNVFLAFDIPDTSANAADALFLVFDPNHNHGANPEGGANPDRALLLTFNNTAAVNAVPASSNFTGTGSGWSVAAAGLPAGWDVKYTRITGGSGKWQVEMRIPFSSTPGFSYLYLNETAAGTDCNIDGVDDDFSASYPPGLTIPSAIVLPTQFPPPVNWTNLQFGPQPPTVSFVAPTCCAAPDIAHSPATQPFTAGNPVTITARVHNQHATSTANNVNVEIRVHDFGTGGTVISPFPLSTQIASIPPSGSTVSPTVTWPSPPAGLHGCIRAQITAPTTSQYFIAAGLDTVQRNVDVACIPRDQIKQVQFNAFNPDKEFPLNIFLTRHVLLPPGFEGIKFDLQQPDRPLRPQEAFPIRLRVSASGGTPLTEVPTQTIKVPATAGGTAIPPFHERSGTDAVVIAVKPGDRLHFTANGEVDLDGRGPFPASGPDGRDASSIGQRAFLLGGEAGGRVGGALLGSFNNFANSFVIGTEGTVDVPGDVKELKLAVNDFEAGYGDNSGDGFAVTIATLPPLNPTDTGGVILETDTAKVTLPQIDIVAASQVKVTAGQHTYNLLRNHGGVTYQFLVVNPAGHEMVGGGKYGWKFFFWIFLLLLVVVILILLFLRIARKKRAA